MKYWIGTMNRVMVTNDDEYPVKKEAWEKHKEEWREVSYEDFKKAYANAWDIACETFWHC